MTYIVSDRFAKDLASPAAGPIKDQILKTLQHVKENPSLPGLRVRRSHMGVRYCRVNDDWRILFDWNHDGEPEFFRVVSHAEFDGLTAESLGGGSITTIQAVPSPHVSTSHPVEGTAVAAERLSIRKQGAEVVSTNPLRGYSITQLRLLGVPEAAVHEVRKAASIEIALEIPGLPDHAISWLTQLATAPADPITKPFEVMKVATMEQLEGFCDGKIQDLLLRLAPDQESFVNSDQRGAILLRGCAGSGKSTVGVYRAIRLALEGRRVLVIAFSPILQQVTAAMVRRLIGELPENLEIVHMREWAKRILTSTGIAVTPISSQEELALIGRAIESIRPSTLSRILDRGPLFFQNEFRRVLKGLAIQDFSEYRGVARYGQKSALSPAARFVVWRVFEAYQALLQASELHDWGDYLVALAHACGEGAVADVIDDFIVDEAQDLSPIELMAIGRAAADETRQSLLILGDAAQSVYSRGFTWRQIGIDIGRQSYALRRNYRNTREVVRTASDLISRNTHLKIEGELTPIESVDRSGPRPVVLVYETSASAVQDVCQRIVLFREQNMLRLRDIAVLTMGVRNAEQYYDALVTKGIPAHLWLDGASDIAVFDETVKIMDLHLAKGLEFPVVFLTGLEMLGSGSTAGLPEHIDAEIELERRRMLAYVGITRSAELLFIVANRTQQSTLVNELNFIQAQPASRDDRRF